MEKIIDKFLRYVAVETTSNDESDSQPSSACQLDLLRMLADELNAMGVKATLDEWGYVMANAILGGLVKQGYKATDN